MADVLEVTNADGFIDFNVDGEVNLEDKETNLLEGFDKDGEKKTDGDDKQAEKADDKQDGATVVESPEKKEDTTDPVSKKEPVAAAAGNDYKSILLKMSKDGIIDDLESMDFDMDGKVVNFNDLKVDTEEEFLNMVKTMSDYKKEKLLEGKIDAGQVSDFTKKLIKADKEGADITTFLKQYEKYQAPIDKWDMNDRTDQLRIIKHYYSSIGLPQDEIDDLMDDMEKKDDEFIQNKALKFKGVIQDAMDQQLAQMTEQAKERKKQMEEDLKVYKKNVKENIKKNYQVNDKTLTKLMDFGFKDVGDGKNGMLTEATKKFRELMMNPETAPDLLVFLMDQDMFVKQKSQREINQNARNVIKLIGSTQKQRQSSAKEEEKTLGGFVPLDEIK